jgi:hypothetical protein
MAVKPTLYNDTVLPPAKPADTVSVAFYVDADGNVKRPPTTNGDPWVTIGTLTTPVEWCTFVVHTDYVNEQWDLYVSQGLTYLQACTRLNAAPIPFNNGTPSSLTQVEVQGITTLDAVALTKDRTQVVDANSNGDYVKVVVLHVPVANTSYECNLYGSAYASGQNKVSENQALGLDMLEWLATGDDVYVYTPTAAYKGALNLGAAWDDVNGGTGVLITDATGVQVKKTSPGWFVGFFDYDTLTEETQQVNIEGAKYWNLLAWGKDTASDTLGSGTHLGIDGGRFDNLYLIRNNVVSAFAWSITLSTWVNSQGQLATDVIQPGETFWVYRFNNTTPWDLRTAQ